MSTTTTAPPQTRQQQRAEALAAYLRFLENATASTTAADAPASVDALDLSDAEVTAHLRARRDAREHLAAIVTDEAVQSLRDDATRESQATADGLREQIARVHDVLDQLDLVHLLNLALPMVA